MAKDEYGLTTNQRAFCDEYIANKGNATQAYLKAYPNVKKESTARVNGSKLLTMTNISDYIAKRTSEILEKAKMKGDEIITSLTAIARRERQESYSKQYNHVTGEVTKEVTYTFQPSIEEQTKALELLAKFAGLDDPNYDLKRKRLEVEIKVQANKINEETSTESKLAEYVANLREAYGHH